MLKTLKYGFTQKVQVFDKREINYEFLFPVKYDMWVYAYSEQNFNFARFGWKIEIKLNDFVMLWNLIDPFYVFFFIDDFANNELKIQFMCRDFHCFVFFEFLTL